MPKLSLAVILPSRGLAFSETIENILQELSDLGAPYKIFFSHNRPIPDCFNVPLEEALATNPSHIWFVEDDMILPRGILKRFVEAKVPAVAVDYPVTKSPSGSVLYATRDSAYFTGTGCLLVEADIIKKLPKPVFRADIGWTPSISAHGVLMKAKSSPDKPYGLHDITFGVKLYMMGYPIMVLRREQAAQHKLLTLGRVNTNKGVHNIITIDKLLRNDHSLLWARTAPEDKSDGFMTLEVDGRIVFVKKELGEKMLSMGARQTSIKRGSLTLEFKDAMEVMDYFK